MANYGNEDFYYPDPNAGAGPGFAWGDNTSGGVSYDMDATFGQEQHFQSFDYSKSGIQDPQPYGAPQQVPYADNYYAPSAQLYHGQLLTPKDDIYSGTSAAPPSGTDFDDEPPLLEELGINPDHILQKTLAVLNPLRATDATILQDTDLAGPLAFCLAFGGCLLLSGKVHFSYIYGIGVLGCLAMYALLNLMSVAGVSVGVTVSVLGYCLLPMVALSGLSVLFSLQGIVGILLTVLAILWCSLSASKLFVTALAMDHQQPLIPYVFLMSLANAETKVDIKCLLDLVNTLNSRSMDTTLAHFGPSSCRSRGSNTGLIHLSSIFRLPFLPSLFH